MDGKLAAILAKSQKIFDRAEELKPLNSPSREVVGEQTFHQSSKKQQWGNQQHQAPVFQEPVYQEPIYEQQYPSEMPGFNVGPKGVGAKNLPKEILEMMTNNPSTYNPMGTLTPTLDNELEIFKQQQQRPIQQQIFENTRQNDYILVSESELKKMINETLKNFLTQFSTKIQEATIKKTVSTILKEQRRG